MERLIATIAAMMFGTTAFAQGIPDWSAICDASGAQSDANFTLAFGMPAFCGLSTGAQRSQLNKMQAVVRHAFNADCVNMTPRRADKLRVCFRDYPGYDKVLMVGDDPEFDGFCRGVLGLEYPRFRNNDRGRAHPAREHCSHRGMARVAKVLYTPNANWSRESPDGHVLGVSHK